MFHLVLPCLSLLVIFSVFQNYQRLRSIPGPFLAKFSNLWRFVSVLKRSPEHTQLKLHQQHGALVRLGPNCVSVQGAEYNPQIYGIGKGFIKSDYYAVFQNVVNGRRAASLVAMTNESDHARTKRAIANAYALSTLVEFEVLVDSTIRVFLEVLGRRFAQTGQVCDLGKYLQYFAFDVIGELTFSKRLGFLEQGQDVDNIISAIGANFSYFSVLGQMPWLDDLLGKNPFYVKYFRKPVSSPILLFAQRLLHERLEKLESGEKTEDEALNKPDFLSRFLAARKDIEDQEMMNDGKLLSYLFMNINAGSDTIASTLRAIFYYLLTNPDTLQELHGELREAHENGKLTTPTPIWSETLQLHYLGAVIKEGLRLNPALSLSLERVVPPDGVTLASSNKSSTHLPSGTTVGINPWVQHRSPAIYGHDAEQWNPTRWLSEQEKETKFMEHNLLTFGAGKRSCLGKNIAMLELHKVVPALIVAFDLTIENPKAWTVRNKWVLDQTGLLVRLRER